MDDPQLSKASCSCRPSQVPIFSVIDLSAFEHDKAVEETLRSFPFVCKPCTPTKESSSQNVQVSTVHQDDATEDHIPDMESVYSESSNETDSMPELRNGYSTSSSASGSTIISEFTDATDKDICLTTSTCPVELPKFVDVYPEVSEPQDVSCVLQALHQHTLDITALEMSAVEYYEALSVSAVELHTELPPRAHVDGGALATTTDRLDYIWAYR
jgi:hypothetical protein